MSWLAGWLGKASRQRWVAATAKYSQAHSSVPSPQLPPAADCLLALAPSFTPARKQARQAHRLLAHIVGGLHLCSATPTPLPETTNCRQHGCPQSVAMRPVQGLKRAGEKLCPGHPEWGNTEWQSRGGVRRPGPYASACNSSTGVPSWCGAWHCGPGHRPHRSTPREHSAAGKLSPCWLPDCLPGAAHRTRTRLFGSRGHHGTGQGM